MNALAAITSFGADNRWLLKIEPGTYDVAGTTLIMKPYVDIEGSGAGMSRIVGSSGTTVRGESNAELRFLTVVSTGGSTSIAVRNSFVSARFIGITAIASGGTHNVAVFNEGSSALLRDVTLTAIATPGTISYGLQSRALSTPVLERVQITATGGFNAYGILNDTSDMTITDSTVRSGGATNDSNGVFNASIDSSNHSVAIRNSSIDSDGIGIITIPALGTSYSVTVDGSQIRGRQLAVFANGPRVLIGSSRVDGRVESFTPGTTVCAGVFDAAYTFFASSCP